MLQLPFTEKERGQGRACFLQGGVVSIDFSEGTYQIEVKDKDESFWPFLQLDDEGQVLDAFCTCQEKGHCFHLAAAYFALFRGHKIPLHKRFRESFWNQLCRIGGKKNGYRADRLLKGKGWEARSDSNDLLFFVKPLDKVGKEKIFRIIEKRPMQTEENSLKFSNLSEEELALWKNKRPSDKLRYALSFWSDLARWLFFLQEDEKPYSVIFSPKNKLPNWVTVRFSHMECGFALDKEDWPDLIPTLRTIASPLTVYDPKEETIHSIVYEPQQQCFLLKRSSVESFIQPEETPEHLKSWQYMPNKGFINLQSDPLLGKDRIDKEEIEKFLSQHAKFLQKHLSDSVHDEVHKLQYHLAFDEKEALHIEVYLFKKGDLSVLGAALWGRWAYIPDTGFYYLFPPLFPAIKTIISKDKVGHFIEKSKNWLQGIEGFQTHVMSLESNLLFSVEEAKSGDLLFHAEIGVLGEGLEALDFQGWIYVQDKGFFPKKKDLLEQTIYAGQRIHKADVSLFIRRHKEELKGIAGFFSDICPIESIGLKVELQGKEISIEPAFSFISPYNVDKVHFYGDYTYVAGEGFARISPIPPELEGYLEKVIVKDKQEAFFLAQIKELKPWIIEMDPRLMPPKRMNLCLKEMESSTNTVQANEWLLGLYYKTEIGTVEAYEIWEAIQAKKNILCSEAGCIDLSHSRFQWFRALPKKRWAQKRKAVHLSALEWIRLQTIEEISLPTGEEKTKQLFESFRSFQGMLPFSIETLQSHLRPYQETGAKWLWFLYGYGLSGLLCDEMGLGKTHQAMALMASASALPGPHKRFLVVCPTSVIYHWEELLKRFLPDFVVRVFHGPMRSRERLQEDHYHVLLTSYGMVRSDRKILTDISFDIAIYDEIQNAKNARSLLHKALKSLLVRVAIGLTGTPIENRVTDLKALLDLVLPHYLPSDAAFKEHFVIPIEKQGDKDKKQLLSQMVRPFILRRKKSEVLLELPEKTEEIAYCDLSDEQRKLYQELYYLHREEVRKEVDRRPALGGGMHIFALFSKLKQICNHPALVEGEIREYGVHSSGKWDLFVELLEEARDSGQKVVVFTQYLGMMDIIQTYLHDQGIGYAEIRGSTRNRKQALERFRSDPTCEVFVASLQAAGVGIDLTAASVVIHYDRWWNPAKENQATDRVHRIGQSRGVQVFKLVTKKTIEERIHSLILTKQSLLEGVVGFDEQDFVKKLTRKEIHSLFSSIEEDF